MKIFAIHSGSDWYDASAEYVVLPEGVNIEDEKIKYDTWYREVYCKQTDWHNKTLQYMRFSDWLIANGGRVPTGNELEIFEV